MCQATHIAAWGALVGLVLSSAPASAQTSAQPQHERRLAHALNNPDWAVDDQGRAFRVVFDPHNRVLFDYGAFTAGQGGLDQRVHAGWKTTLGLDFAEENIWWRFRHTFADVEYRWQDGLGRLESTLIGADYLRHDESSFVVIPAEQDIKLPAPFDIGVEYELVSVDLAHDRGDWSLEGIDVAEVAIPLDFVRDPDYRHRLAVGPAGLYRVDAGQEPWRHELAPFSGVQLLYAWESDDGLYQVDVRGRCVRSVSVGGASEPQWRTRCEARAGAEVIALSVNDQPVSIPAEFEVHDDFAGETEWSAFVGVRLSLSQTL